MKVKKPVMDSSCFAFRFAPIISTRPNDAKIKEWQKLSSRRHREFPLCSSENRQNLEHCECSLNITRNICNSVFPQPHEVWAFSLLHCVPSRVVYIRLDPPLNSCMRSNLHFLFYPNEKGSSVTHFTLYVTTYINRWDFFFVFAWCNTVFQLSKSGLTFSIRQLAYTSCSTRPTDENLKPECWTET